MLSKNKITTYLLYAIGEIFLVVVGILIAVGIDDRSQNRKERIQESKFIQLLIRDLQADSVALSTGIAFSDHVVRSKSIYLAYSKSYPKSDSLPIYLRDAIFATVLLFVPNEGAIEEIKNAGGISLIKNDSLSGQILKLYNDYQTFEKNVSQYHLDNTLRIRELVYQKSNGQLFYGSDDLNHEILENLALESDIRNRVINNWAYSYNRRLKELADLNKSVLSNSRNYLQSF